MSHRTFRVSTMTCMACGHEQRCKLQVENGIEFEPDCWSCGRSDSWMSLPTIHVGPEPVPVHFDAYRRLVSELLHPSAFDPETAAAHWPEAFWNHNTDNAAAFTVEDLVAFAESQGIEVELVEEDDE